MVTDKLRQEYIDHLNMPNKKPLQEWENKRKEIHEKIFKEMGLERNSKEGKAFSKKFDESIEREITSMIEIFAKRITNSESKEEMEQQVKTLEFLQKWGKK